MRFYPAYTKQQVLDEYAVSFFTLLNEAYRLEYKHYIMLASIVSTPHMKREQRREFLQQLEWASKPPDDILRTDDDDEGNIDGVKNLLRNI